MVRINGQIVHCLERSVYAWQDAAIIYTKEKTVDGKVDIKAAIVKTVR